MKYFAIAPIAHLDLIKEERHHMVITPFLKIPEVMKFYKEQKETGATIMMDNGEFEAEAIDIEEYIEYIKILEPDIVVLPDAWKDASKTYSMHSTTLGRLEDEGLTPVCIFVPHGKNLLNYIQCLANIVNRLMHKAPTHDNLVGLAFAEWGDTSGIIRPFLSHHLMERPGIFHFLGLYNTRELWTCSEKVVSVDSSFPFKAALQDINISISNGTVITDTFDFHAKLNNKQVDMAKLNLKMMHYICEKKIKENPFEVLR